MLFKKQTLLFYAVKNSQLQDILEHAIGYGRMHAATH